MTRGIELNTPSVLILKFLIATLKLSPKSGVTSLFTKHTNMIAKTMYMLMTKLKNEENLSALRVLGKANGNTITKQKTKDQNIWPKKDSLIASGRSPANFTSVYGNRVLKRTT
jgi:hypothetical protein